MYYIYIIVNILVSIRLTPVLSIFLWRVGSHEQKINK